MVKEIAEECEWVIRKGKPEDVDAIVHLEEITFPFPWSRESIRHDMEENPLAVILVAEWKGDFAGYMDVWRIAGEGQLNNIAVMPAARGHGIGGKLMQEMMDYLQKQGDVEISLEVRASNEAAIHLYQKLGFEEIGRREKYYLDNGEDALLMRRTLRPEKE